jgi:AcrR family transcriptional regulator
VAGEKTEPLRRLPRAQRREQILGAATEAFARSGFEATSLDDIAAQAGITRVILYRHFDSKTELYQAVLDQMCARLEAHVEEPVGGLTDASIDSLLEAAAESPAGFRLLFHYALREPEFSERIEKFRADITAAAYLQISALVPDEALARWAAQLALVVAIEAITAWLDVGQPEPAEAAGRVRQAVMGVIGAAAASDVDCSLPSPAHLKRTIIMTSIAKARTGETPAARQKRVWDKSAPGYDKQIALFEKIWFGGGREWLGERAHGRVLEVAVGTGRNLPHYPAYTTVSGIELSPAMLDRPPARRGPRP